jgi:anthranilate/para-aminobenzoate synthase component II
VILLVDNYDSFTYNLAHLFQELGAEVTVVRNDKIDADEAERLQPSHLVISPGPDGRRRGREPRDRPAPGERVPTSASASGHQAIVEAYGGEVGQAKRLMHGKASPVAHDGGGSSPAFPIRSRAAATTRSPQRVSPIPSRSARPTEDGEVMAVRHASSRSWASSSPGIGAHARRARAGAQLLEGRR